MSADHAQTEIVSGHGLVAALETQASEAVIQGRSSVVAERMERPSGEHDVFVEIDPELFSLVETHFYTLKLSMACSVSE